MENTFLAKAPKKNFEDMLFEALDMLSGWFITPNAPVVFKLPRTTIAEVFRTGGLDAFVNPSRDTFKTDNGYMTLKDDEVFPFTTGVNFCVPLIDKIEEASLEITPLVLSNKGLLRCAFDDYYANKFHKDALKVTYVTIENLLELDEYLQDPSEMNITEVRDYFAGLVE